MLVRGFYTRIIYNLESSTMSDGYNSFIISEDSSEIDRTSSFSIKN